MRSLHVAALPFPSPQGTQALLHAMLSALTEEGHDTHLACYGYGASQPPSARYALHRLPFSLGLRSLRSGPGLRKLALDAMLAREVQTLMRRLEPDVVVAHHVEAALACLLVSAPFVYVAHTSLRDELPSYFPTASAAVLRRAGSGLDRRACRGAARALAVAPALAERLRLQTQVKVHVLTLPWPIPAPITEHERVLARAQLGFDHADRVLLYAGNLDAYQGLDGLAESVRQLAAQGGKLFLLVATASDPATCAVLRAPGLPVRFAPLASEAERRLVHAAADLVVIPRAVAGGVPIKLLDALARGTKVVTTQRAAAGLDLGDACVVVQDDDPGSFAQACASLLRSAPAALAQAARAYVESAHLPSDFVAQFVDVGLRAHSF